ncbi:carotenoid oxygenase family protein [Leptolyngbya sp. PCC 6406]|uniref:carotenoid oxygenase family protein n=1 Tax=Leptolyngbya sp. PCC 6406 TaxID=1173264 RepID=UPI0004871179|nr:carotenoid oxygenase family protein [Leptolyngbya sp. PCC 6406]
MAIATEPVQQSWGGAIAVPAQEFSLTPLSVQSGQLPQGLRGSLYRNGPGRLERQGRRVAHWFDGDGAVLAVHFAGGEATATYRYVRSAGYVAEEAADQFLYNGYGSLAPGPLWQRLNTQLKNAANTAVLALPDRVLALWEGGWPHRLDLDTLATEGIDALGQLAANEPYSAHPKRHPTTGDIFNFGLVAGANATLNLYRSGVNGNILQKQALPLNGIPLIHDFVLADRYLVFCVPPVRLNALPAVLGLKSFSDALMWQPRQGTQLIVIEADTLEVVSWGETEPWFQWHFGKGYVDEFGDIVLEVVRYPDFATNQYLKEVAQGHIQTSAAGHLWRLRINPQAGTVQEQSCLVNQSCEFPSQGGGVDIAQTPTYLAIHRPEPASPQGELFGAIARFDPHSETLTIADAGPGRYPAEPLYVAADDGGGWVLTVVYDGTEHRSEVWIYDSEQLEAPPLCRLALPSVIPPSFHGTWHPRT